MSHTKGRQLGFFMALTMLVGSVVGIGIFFKSHGILRSNDWNGTGTFLAWLMGGIISLTAAVSFSEIGSMKTGKTAGLSAWAEKVGGKKFGYFVRFNYSFFYFGLLGSVLAVFGSEMLIKMIATFNTNFDFNSFPVYGHILIGFAILIGFLTLNFISLRTSGFFQIAATVLKWIPLLIVVFAGLILWNKNNGHGPILPAQYGQNAFKNGHSFTLTGMLAALPAVLFAFDAFLNVGTLQNRMTKPKKFPLVMIAGMSSVLILYLLIALAAIFHGTGMVSGSAMGLAELGIFGQVFSGSTLTFFSKFTMIFMVISTLGVINGFSAATIATHTQAIETDTIIGAKSLKKKLGLEKTIILYTAIVATLWTAIFGIPASVLNSDSIVDGVSNFPTLFFFAIYGAVIVMYTLKRKKMETRKMNDILFHIFAGLAVIGIAIAVAYQFFYGLSFIAIEKGANTAHWGLFAGDKGVSNEMLPSKFPGKEVTDFGVAITLAQASIVLVSFLAIFLIAPIINKIATKKFENNEVFINTFE